MVRKWRPYLLGQAFIVLGQAFIVKTDQQALKFLLEQRVRTPTQQKWVSILMGYEFTINYKKGKENKVVDALSRVEENLEVAEGSLAMISFPNSS